MGKTVVFDGKMGMRKFGSTAPPFGKVACAVKVLSTTLLSVNTGLSLSLEIPIGIYLLVGPWIILIYFESSGSSNN